MLPFCCWRQKKSGFTNISFVVMKAWSNTVCLNLKKMFKMAWIFLSDSPFLDDFYWKIIFMMLSINLTIKQFTGHVFHSLFMLSPRLRARISKGFTGKKMTPVNFCCLSSLRDLKGLSNDNWITPCHLLKRQLITL